MYVPESAVRGAPVLVAVHGVSRNAHEQAVVFSRLCDARGAVLLVPIFTKEQHRDYQRLGRKGRGPRVDLLLQRYLSEVASLSGADVTQIRLFGFSGARSSPTAISWPIRIASARAVAAASGWYTFPDRARKYPYGIRVNRSLRGSPLQPGTVPSGPDRRVHRKPRHRADQHAQQRGSRRAAGRGTASTRARRWVAAMRTAASAYGLRRRVSSPRFPTSTIRSPRFASAGRSWISSIGRCSVAAGPGRAPSLRARSGAGSCRAAFRHCRRDGCDGGRREAETSSRSRGGIEGMDPGRGSRARPQTSSPDTGEDDPIGGLCGTPPGGEPTATRLARGALGVDSDLGPRHRDAHRHLAAVPIAVRDVEERRRFAVISPRSGHASPAKSPRSLVDVGDKVVAGQILIQLEDRHLRAEVQEAGAQVAGLQRTIEVERMDIAHERRKIGQQNRRRQPRSSRRTPRPRPRRSERTRLAGIASCANPCSRMTASSPARMFATPRPSSSRPRRASMRPKPTRGRQVRGAVRELGGRRPHDPGSQGRSARGGLAARAGSIGARRSGPRQRVDSCA